MTLAWYAIHSKPNREDLLWKQLLNRKVEVFYPRIRVKPVNPRSRTIKPYFPGYLFARVDLNQVPLSSFAWLPGANRVVSFDGEPAAVPDFLIGAIEKQVERINTVGLDPFGGLQAGDEVIIQSGPFEGYEAIFDERLDGKERVRVLLKLLQNKQVRLDVPVGQIERKKSR